MAKKNLIVGSLWVFLFMFLGFILEMKAGGSQEWKDSAMHHLWKTAHLHGGIFGMLNILYGLLIANLRLDGKTISAGSVLAVIGSAVFPVSLFLGGINFSFVYAAPLGGLSMIAAWAIMSYTLATRKE